MKYLLYSKIRVAVALFLSGLSLEAAGSDFFLSAQQSGNKLGMNGYVKWDFGNESLNISDFSSLNNYSLLIGGGFSTVSDELLSNRLGNKKLIEDEFVFIRIGNMYRKNLTKDLSYEVVGIVDFGQTNISSDFSSAIGVGPQLTVKLDSKESYIGSHEISFGTMLYHLSLTELGEETSLSSFISIKL